MLWEANLAVTNQSIHFLRLFGIERTPSATHLEKQHTKRPEIDMFAVTFLVKQNFRREISVRVS